MLFCKMFYRSCVVSIFSDSRANLCPYCVVGVCFVEMASHVLDAPNILPHPYDNIQLVLCCCQHFISGWKSVTPFGSRDLEIKSVSYTMEHNVSDRMKDSFF